MWPVEDGSSRPGPEVQVPVSKAARKPSEKYLQLLFKLFHIITWGIKTQKKPFQTSSFAF